MTNHEINCDCYFRHSRPTFVGYPHVIIYPSKILIDIIADVTETVPRLWPVLSELILRFKCDEEKSLDRQIEWESERCREVLRSYSGSGHFATEFGLFCDAQVTDNELETYFPADVLDDPWYRILELVDMHNWIMVPDEQGVLFVIIFSHAMSYWIDKIKLAFSSSQLEWSQVMESASGAIECTGFMAKFGER
jgi:hypothetical protein